MKNTNIEWCDHTFNPWIGCTKVSPGCKNCYAETLDNMRFSKTLGDGTRIVPVSHWGKGAPRHRTSEANWKQALKWNRQAEISISGWRAGISLGNTEKELLDRGFIKPHRPRVFCASLADWLDDEVPVEWLSDLLYLVIKCKNLDWLLLTKRPQLWRTRLQEVANHSDIGAMIATHWLDGNPPPNVWVGTTCENQAMADKRIPELLAIPAKVRFLSCEPLLEAVTLSEKKSDGECYSWLCDTFHDPNSPTKMRQDPPRIHWVIAGGESGPGFRPFDPDWARSLRDQCKAAGVAFFMKQMGGARKPFPEIPEDLMIREFPTVEGQP